MRFFIQLLCSLVLLCLTSITHAQASYEKLFQDHIPNAPNAASLTNYGNTSVDYFSGSPQIQIPIHTFSEGPLSVPISLSFDASGVKVAEVPSWVGMNWTLNVGGVISRTVRSSPDESTTVNSGWYTNYGYDKPGKIDNATGPTLVENLRKAGTGIDDTEPDMFHFHFNGRSGKFYFDENRNPILTEHDDFKIEVEYESSYSGAYSKFKYFTITDVDGTKYFFGGTPGAGRITSSLNRSTTNGGGAFTYYPYVSSWNLVRIEDVNGDYGIDFQYVHQNYTDHILGTYAFDFKDCLGQAPPNVLEAQVHIEYEEARLDKISGTHGEVWFHANTVRNDLDIFNDFNFNLSGEDPKRLDEIEIRGTFSCLKKFKFEYIYAQSGASGFVPFGFSEDPVYSGTPPDQQRLVLTDLKEQSCSASIINIHQFDYAQLNSIPRRRSHSVDHYGYNNGKYSNENLIPDLSICELPINGNGFDESLLETCGLLSNGWVSDRETVESPMLYGSLEKITYPSGGSSTFEFEANRLNTTVNTRPTSSHAGPVSNCGQPASCDCELISADPPVSLQSVSVPTPNSSINEDYRLAVAINRGTCGTACDPGTADIYVDLSVKNSSGVVIYSTQITLMPSENGYYNEFDLGPGKDIGIAYGANYTYEIDPTSFPCSPLALKLSLEIKRRYDSYVNKDVLVGGLRVKSITDDPVIGPTVKTNYSYLKPDPSDTTQMISSGQLIYFPKYILENEHYDSPGLYTKCMPGICQNAIYTISSQSITSMGTLGGRNMGYEIVTVEKEAVANGYTEYTFNAGTSPFCSSSPGNAYYHPNNPAPREYYVSPLIGKLIYEKNYSETGSLVSSKYYEYTLDQVCSEISPWSFVHHTTCNDVNCTNLGQATFRASYNIRSYKVLIERETNVLDGVTTITDYTYHANKDHFQPIRIDQTGPAGILTTHTQYAEDISGDPHHSSSVLSAMITENMVGIPLTTYTDGLQKGGSKTVFVQSNGRILPSKMYEQEGSIWDLQAEYLYTNSDPFPDQIDRPHYTNNIQLNWFLPYSSSKGGLLQNYTYLSHTKSYDYYTTNRQVRFITEIDGQRSQFLYDALQRVKEQRVFGSGSVYKNKTSYTYNIDPTGSNNYVETNLNINGNERKTKVQVDGLGREIKTTLLDHSPSNGDVVTKEIVYDNGGRVDQVIDYVQGTTSYTYEDSPLNREKTMTFSDGSILSYDYLKTSTDEFLKRITDENGNITEAATDFLGRTISSTAKDGSTNQVTSYSYDSFGRLAYVYTPENKTYEYRYDSYGRLKEKVVPGAGLTSYTYYSNDLLKTITDANLDVVLNEYDNYDRIKTVKLNGTIISEKFYDKSGSGTIWNGKLWKEENHILNSAQVITSEVKSLDAYGRVLIEENNNLLGGLDKRTYTYDLMDNILTEDIDHTGGQTTNIDITRYYDHAFRYLGQDFQLNSGTTVRINDNIYNDKDQLDRKRIWGQAGIILQDIDYTYNSRGWLTKINELISSGDPINVCAPTEGPCQLCPYETSFAMSMPTQGNEFITDVNVSGGQSLALNYPYGMDQLDALKTDIEEVLIQEEVNFDAVDIRREGSQVTLRIHGTNIPINSIKVFNGDNFEVSEYVFDMTESTVPVEEIVDICDVCELAGYDCFQCPIGKFASLPGYCNYISFTDCHELASGQACVTCNELGYEDCTDCPLTVLAIEPLSLQFTFDQATVQGNTSKLLNLRSRARFWLSDGTSLVKEQISHLSVPQAGVLQYAAAGEMLEIEFPINQVFIGSDNTPDAIQAIANKVYSEFMELLPEATMSQADFTTSLASELDGQWGGYAAAAAPPPPPPSNPISEDLYAIEYDYQTAHSPSGAHAQYNGNISGMTWQMAGRKWQTYGFWYDGVDRIKEAEYADQLISGTWSTDNKYRARFSYDKDGNLLTIRRNGVNSTCTNGDGSTGYNFGEIDHMALLYNAQNRLYRVSEFSDKTRGYQSATTNSDYGYDNNGNITSVSGQGLSITYNHLNLPNQILKNSNSLTFSYDASGVKHRKVALEQGLNGLFYTHDYCGPIEIRGNQLYAVYHEEGRVVLDGGNQQYEFALKDHLGNTRLTFCDLDVDGFISYPGHRPPSAPANPNYTEILQENHYYPFGMAMEGPWQAYNPAKVYDYQYNHKELEGEFGLDWMDYGARYYDASIGRWNAVDPLVDSYTPYNPYNYTLNNPISNFDPNGMYSVSFTGELAQQVFRQLQNGSSVNDVTKPFDKLLNAYGNALTSIGDYRGESIIEKFDQYFESFGQFSNFYEVEGFPYSTSILSDNIVTFGDVQLSVNGTNVDVEQIAFIVGPKGYNAVTGSYESQPALASTHFDIKGPVYQIMGQKAAKEIRLNSSSTLRGDGTGRIMKGWVKTNANQHGRIEQQIANRSKAVVMSHIMKKYKSQNSRDRIIKWLVDQGYLTPKN